MFSVKTSTSVLRKADVETWNLVSSISMISASTSFYVMTCVCFRKVRKRFLQLVDHLISAIFLDHGVSLIWPSRKVWSVVLKAWIILVTSRCSPAKSEILNSVLSSASFMYWSRSLWLWNMTRWNAVLNS